MYEVMEVRDFWEILIEVIGITAVGSIGLYLLFMGLMGEL